MFTKLSLTTACLGLGLLMMAGCSKSSDSTAATTSVLDGTWASACQANTNYPGSQSIMRTLVFQNGGVTDTTAVFSDANCTTAIMDTAETASFTIGSAETSPANSYDLTFVQTSDSATSVTAGETTTLNTGNGGGDVCTGVTFVTDQAENIAGVACGGGSSPAQPANGATLLNVYSLSGTTLELGATTGATDLGNSGSRPTTLDTSTTFTKQ